MPWHDAQWQQLRATSTGLPHALLLTGPDGVGKGLFAKALAARLLCEAPQADGACGSCPSCRWFVAGNHPDFRHVIPEADAEKDTDSADGEKKKASRQIRIDQIRELEDFVFIGAHRDGGRVLVIEPAEAMNLAAANAVLKILEEPPASVYFILVSSSWRRLLPTIRSRCRILKLGRPPLPDAQAWLQQQDQPTAAELLPLMGGAPLAALRESEGGRGTALANLLGALAEPGRDPLALAGRWEAQLKNDGGLTMETLVAVLQKWLFDLALHKLAGRTRFLDGRGEKLAAMLAKAPAQGLIRCYNDLVKMRALASHPLNPRLFLEDLAVRYLRALAVDRP